MVIFLLKLAELQACLDILSSGKNLTLGMEKFYAGISGTKN